MKKIIILAALAFPLVASTAVVSGSEYDREHLAAMERQCKQGDTEKCELLAYIRAANARTPLAEITARITLTEIRCEQRHINDMCVLLPKYKALQKTVRTAQRKCKLPIPHTRIGGAPVESPITAFYARNAAHTTNPTDQACKFRDSIYTAIQLTRADDNESASVAHATISKDLDWKHPLNIPGQAVDQLGDAAKSLVPKDRACWQYTLNTDYHQAVLIVNNTKDQLATAGVRDRDSCNSAKKVVAAIIAKMSGPYGAITGPAADKFGGCVCSATY